MKDYVNEAFRIMEDRELNMVVKQIKMETLIKELLPKEEKPKPKHWPGMFKPEEGAPYFAWERPGILNNFDQERTEIDRARSSCCKTEKEAEFVKAHLEARRDLIDRIAELNEGWRPDWDDPDQEKYAPRFDHEDDEIIVIAYHEIQSSPDCFHGKSGVWQQIIEEFGEDKIRLAIWPEYEEEA